MTPVQAARGFGRSLRWLAVGVLLWVVSKAIPKDAGKVFGALFRLGVEIGNAITEDGKARRGRL